jgi:hypothetical protein
MVFYGFDGTGKTGVAMDCRNEEDIKLNKNVIVIDLDGAAGPLKTKFYHKDEHMIVIDPISLTPDGEIDYVTSHNKTLAIIRYITEHEEELNLKAVLLDGLDTLLKNCEYVMRYEDLKVDPMTQIKDQWQWQNRNRHYFTIIVLLKHLKCDKYFTTHLKGLKKYKGGALSVDGYAPDWQDRTPGMLFQKILLERKSIGDKVIFVATIEKAKGALGLEGRKYEFATVQGANIQWTGLQEMFDEVRKSD